MFVQFGLSPLFTLLAQTEGNESLLKSSLRFIVSFSQRCSINFHISY